jgi:hypothetical protein
MPHNKYKSHIINTKVDTFMNFFNCPMKRNWDNRNDIKVPSLNDEKLIESENEQRTATH